MAAAASSRDADAASCDGSADRTALLDSLKLEDEADAVRDGRAGTTCDNVRVGLSNTAPPSLATTRSDPMFPLTSDSPSHDVDSRLSYQTPDSPASPASLALASCPVPQPAWPPPHPGLQAGGSWREAVVRDWRLLSQAPLEERGVRGDREIVLFCVTQDAVALEWAEEELHRDRDFVLQCVCLNGNSLQYASPELRADREVVMLAIRQDYLSLRHASQDLRADVSLIAEAISLSGRPYDEYGALETIAANFGSPVQSVREAIQALDPTVWKRKVRRDWRRLREAPAGIRHDREIVLEAVRDSWGWALEYAADELRGDRGLVAEATSMIGTTLQFASLLLRGDSDLVLAAVRQHWESVQFASEKLLGDRDFILEAMKVDAEALRFAAPSLRADRELMLRAVRRDGLLLRYASEQLRADPELAIAAFRHNAKAMQYVPEGVRSHIWESSEPYMRLAWPPAERSATTQWLDREP